MPFSTPIEVRFADLDALGHVNNATFITYLEQARWYWWEGFLEGRPFLDEGFLIARVEMDYRKSIVMEDPIRVEIRCTQVGNTSFTLGCKVVRSTDGVVMAEGQTVQVMMDFKTGRPRPLSAAAVAWLKGQA